MRDPLRWGVVALVGLLAACRPAQADDLLEVFRLARANDPVLAAADAQRLGTHDLADQARAALLPQASATAAIVLPCASAWYERDWSTSTCASSAPRRCR